jgi:hypothetical protein
MHATARANKKEKRNEKRTGEIVVFWTSETQAGSKEMTLGGEGSTHPKTE